MEEKQKEIQRQFRQQQEKYVYLFFVNCTKLNCQTFSKHTNSY
jgi:hypothetical protein